MRTLTVSGVIHHCCGQTQNACCPVLTRTCLEVWHILYRIQATLPGRLISPPLELTSHALASASAFASASLAACGPAILSTLCRVVKVVEKHRNPGQGSWPNMTTMFPAPAKSRPACHGKPTPVREQGIPLDEDRLWKTAVGLDSACADKLTAALPCQETRTSSALLPWLISISGSQSTSTTIILVLHEKPRAKKQDLARTV